MKTKLTLHVKLVHPTFEVEAGTLCYHLSYRRQRRCIESHLHLQTKEWLATEQRVVDGDAVHLRAVRACIQSDTAQLHRLATELIVAGATVNLLEDVVQRFIASLPFTRLLAYAQREVIQLEQMHRYGTARNYRRLISSFTGFLGGDDLPLQALTDRIIDDYNGYLLRRGVVRNTISYYMRTLRALYNKAVRQRLIVQDNPFRWVYTGVDTTCKRAVDTETITALYKLSLPEHSPLALARDLFIFSFCARGMSFVDMAYLQKSDIRDGVISYTRHKTHRRLYIRLEHTLKHLLDKYATCSPIYLFPLLQSNDPAMSYHEYQLSLNRYNHALKRLSALLHTERKLSSYTARHSWATAARNHNIPLSIISAGMGHNSERTTQIYLDGLENSVVDSANKALLADIL